MKKWKEKKDEPNKKLYLLKSLINLRLAGVDMMFLSCSFYGWLRMESLCVGKLFLFLGLERILNFLLHFCQNFRPPVLQIF